MRLIAFTALLAACGPSARDYQFGAERWSDDLNGLGVTSIAATPDGDVVIASDDLERGEIRRLAGGNGVVLWRVPLAGYMLHVATSRAGDIYVTGVGKSGAFFSKYAPDGTFEWTHWLGAPGSCGQRITIARDETVYATGGCTGALSFGPTNLDCAGIFIAALAGDGTPLWAQTDVRSEQAAAMPQVAVLADKGVVYTSNDEANSVTAMISVDGVVQWRQPATGITQLASTRAGDVVDVSGVGMWLPASGIRRPLGEGPLSPHALTIGANDAMLVVSGGGLQAFTSDGTLVDTTAAYTFSAEDSLAALPDGALAMRTHDAIVVLDLPPLL